MISTAWFATANGSVNRPTRRAPPAKDWRESRTAPTAIPAPVAYDLLGSVKVLLWYLQEVTEFLPTGVAHSLTDNRLAIYDRGPSGGDRDPAGQLALATDALQTLQRNLSDAAAAAEAAQTALNGQGWNSAGEEAQS